MQQTGLWSIIDYPSFQLPFLPLFRRHITNNISTWIDYRFSYSKQKSYHIFMRFF